MVNVKFKFVFIAINNIKSKENILKINITPYGKILNFLLINLRR